VAVLLAGALAICLSSCGSSQRQTTTVTAATRPSDPAAGANASPRKLATDAAYSFLDSYTTDGGRIQRTDQGGDTVGEGQAYGMLAAAAVGDEQRFDGI